MRHPLHPWKEERKRDAAIANRWWRWGLVVAVAALVAYPASTGPVMYARMRGWLPHAETHPYCQGGSRLAGWFGLWDEAVAYQFWWAKRGLHDRRAGSD